jgi:phosphotransacetylase
MDNMTAKVVIENVKDFLEKTLGSFSQIICSVVERQNKKDEQHTDRAHNVLSVSGAIVEDFSKTSEITAEDVKLTEEYKKVSSAVDEIQKVRIEIISQGVDSPENKAKLEYLEKMLEEERMRLEKATEEARKEKTGKIWHKGCAIAMVTGVVGAFASLFTYILKKK